MNGIASREETEKIWSEFSEQVRGHLLRKVRNEADVDDLLQEVFVKIHRHSGELRDRAKLAPWIYSIVANSVNDYYRRKNPVEVGLDEERTAAPGEEEDDSTECVKRCLGVFVSRLPGKYREALLLSDLEGMRQKEIAERMDISYSGLKSRVQRGRTMIKDMFLDCCANSLDENGNLNPRFHPSDECPVCCG